MSHIKAYFLEFVSARLKILDRNGYCGIIRCAALAANIKELREVGGPGKGEKDDSMVGDNYEDTAVKE